jgi:hypothetical protein
MLDLKKAVMKKVSPDANIYYETNGGVSHLDPRNKLAFKRPLPLSFIKMSKYDVSVSDIVLAGSLHSIIKQLIIIYKRGSKLIYTTDAYKNIKT